MAARTLRNHPITASLARLQELLDDASLQSPSVAADETAHFNREKLQNMTKSLRALVGQSAATLVSETALNQMSANLQSPINELTAFISNKNVGHLANAVAQFDQNILSYTWAFLPKINPLSKAETTELIDSLQERSRQTFGELTSEKEKLLSGITQLTEEIQSQETRLTELKNLQAQSKADLTGALSALETAFNKAQLQRDNDFATMVGEAKESLVEARKTFNDDATLVLEELNNHKANAARIVQVVGDIGVTGNYQKIANAEAKQANLWRRITVGLFACGLAMAGATFFNFYHEPVTADNTLAILVRLLYALAIAAPAFYTARESARHRTNADRARQTELELASLGPFIELMKEQDKEDIRKSLIPTYFGRPVDPHEIKTILDVGGKN